MVNWTKEQQEAIDRKGSNILVAAAAGSGKTAVLVERIIQKLLDTEDPLDIDEILVATFTNAAAEEMRNRIAQRLEKAIAQAPTSYHLKKQLSLLQKASISTLHAFCTSVVRQYAYMIDVDPTFRIADEMEIDLIKQEVIEDLFEASYGREEAEVERFYQVVDMFSTDRSDVAVEQLVLTLYTFAMQNPWPEKWLHDISEQYHVPKDVKEDSLHWLQVLKDEVEQLLKSYIEEANKALEIAWESDGPYEYIDQLTDDIAIFKAALEKTSNWDALQTFMQESKFKNLSRKKMDCNTDKKDQVQAIRKKYRDDFNQIKKKWFARHLQAHLEDMRTLYPVMQELTSLVLQFKARFTAVKRDRAIVDFADLEHFCLAILIDPQSTEEEMIPSSVAKQYQAQFKEILVDEYQDINLVQETILSLVSDVEGAGNMFMVGDVKQSIYGFRHAEPSLFIEKYKQYQADESMGKRIDLAKNFRSREAVLTSTNFVFKQVMDESLGEIAYDDDAALVYGNFSYDEKPIDQPHTELILIDRDGKEEATDETGENIEDIEATRLEARLYAEKIKSWIGKKKEKAFQVIDKETEQYRDVQYRDIVILLRSLTGAPTIVDEFKKQGIPVHAELRTGYFEAIEIQVMLNMLKVIDNPYQDIPLASVLRSPIVGLDEEILTNIRLQDNKGHFYDALKKYAGLQEEASERVNHFLSQLDAFRKLAKEEGLSTLIWTIFERTGYYDFVGGIPGGRQRQANLRALYDRARSYEATSFRGLFRFLRFIERMQEEKKDLGEARALSEQEDVVRVMTIHKSKGLEFPLVILGGMNKQFNLQDLRASYILNKDHGFATKFIDPVQRITYPTLYYLAMREMELKKLLAEEMRVLYVAMTRAKEKLTMIGHIPSFDKLQEKWLDITASETWILPDSLRKKATTYLDWVGPALIRHQDGDILRGQVKDSCLLEDRSLWDVEVVAGESLLDIEEITTVTKEQLQEAIQNWQVMPHLSSSFAEEVEARLNFKYPYEIAAHSRAKQSVSEIKRRQELADVNSDQRFIQPFRPPLTKRPHFLQEEKKLTPAEIGTAMHTVMQHLPFTKKLSEIEIKAYIETFVAEEKMTKEEAAAIDLTAIAKFFTTTIADKMIAHHNQLEREVSFTYRLPAREVYEEWTEASDEFVMLQGIIDCIIPTEEGVFILDYKTDYIADKSLSAATRASLIKRYRTQVTLYRRALESILREEVKASYLYFFDEALLLEVE